MRPIFAQQNFCCAKIGQRLPAYRTDIGKDLLSRHSKEEIFALQPEPWKRYTENTLPDPESLFHKLEETISQNFLLSLLTYSLGLIPVTRLNTFEK